MRTTLLGGIALALVAITAGPAMSDPVGVVKESGRTAGHSVRDGSKTVGRTVRDFFTGGPHKAKRTWKANAAHTRAVARADKARVKAEANE